ncbi:MAG: enoyl-CoA hydratase/isomerase family protein [Euryarchaeota archaeon]|nr:enoyl-CoA hydratase/isomerase family protein [Euryarchaeota archaeon]
MEYTGFRLERKGTIALLTFNQPKVNLFSTPVLRDLSKALRGLARDDSRVLLITGEGKTFVAGADIKEMADFTTREAKRFSLLFQKVLAGLEGLPKPVAAAVNGHALGGGCELVLACDLAIASEDAVFGQPEVLLGIVPGAGGTQRLPQRVGRLRAKELILTGRKITAAEALSMGLVNRVVPRERLMEEAMALAKTLASNPPKALKAAKALIDSGSYRKEAESFSRLFGTEEQRALMKRFLER